MTRPQPRSSMPSITCLVMLKHESRLVRITSSQAALVIFLNVMSRVMPALLTRMRSEEHTSELQSQSNLVCRLLLEKKKKKNIACDNFDALCSVGADTLQAPPTLCPPHNIPVRCDTLTRCAHRRPTIIAHSNQVRNS